MRDLLKTLFTRPKPLPKQWYDKAINDLHWLALDLELTSLDTSVSEVTSAGWVQGYAQQIDVHSSEYYVTRVEGGLNQSPVIHGLTAKDIAQGIDINNVFKHLSDLMTSHIWVLHNAHLDMAILNRVSLALKLPRVTITTIDTMQLELYLQKKANLVIRPDSMTLENCRKQYHLPPAPNHNALDDAFATLQLLYAQLYALDKGLKTELNALWHTKALHVYELGVAQPI